MTTVDRPLKKTKLVPLPSEIIEEILSRLPVRSILRFRSVCKPWLSLISNPSFTKLQFSRAIVSHRSSLFISAYDSITHKRHLFSGAHDHGGPLTHFMTLDQHSDTFITSVTHVNGLVCFTMCTSISIVTGTPQAFVVNPSTRKISKLSVPDSNTNSTSCYGDISYFFGFDESTNDHKILHIRRKDSNFLTLEFMIFSLSSYSWRKIDADPPIGFGWDRFSDCLDGVVCVNNVVHIMHLYMPYDILSFDFSTEKFSLVSIPRGVVQYEAVNGIGFIKPNKPSITKINGCLGVFIHVRWSSEVHIWLLQDYDNRVWVKETIKFPESWNVLVGNGHLSIDANMDDEIVFSVGKVFENVMTMPVYNRKSKSFKSLQFPLDDQVLRSGFVKFDHIKCFVESIMMPL